ncbi:hypothetical protein BH23ACT4_BH23ACT4_04240 [soil metagenome]
MITPSETVYDGFISYSHAADDLLAPRLQAGLQRFAKPWWKRRALRVFRDESSLSANPHLWSSITDALDESAWFVLLLSPDAAQSEWVNQEIDYWKTHRDTSRILPVVTDGDFEWTEGDVSGSTVAESLRGVFTEEPRWVDLRFAREEDQLDLKNPRFSSAVADIASAIRGIPKDELESEEVRQHRRTIRTAWAAAALVGILAVAATVFGIQSTQNAREAETQRLAAETEADRADANAREAEDNATLAGQNERLAGSRGLAASAVAVLDDDPELSTLLALLPDRVDDHRHGHLETSLVEFGLGLVRGLSISPDERKIALGDENGLHIADLHSGVLEQSIPLPSVSDIHWFDAETVLVGGTDGIWARIPLKESDLISLARDNLTRGFSSQECATYRIDSCPTLEEMRDG